MNAAQVPGGGGGGARTERVSPLSSSARCVAWRDARHFHQVHKERLRRLLQRKHCRPLEAQVFPAHFVAHLLHLRWARGRIGEGEGCGGAWKRAGGDERLTPRRARAQSRRCDSSKSSAPSGESEAPTRARLRGGSSRATTHQAAEGQLPKEQVRALLIAPDFAQRARARAPAVRLLPGTASGSSSGDGRAPLRLCSLPPG
jgi:hypothetical protein